MDAEEKWCHERRAEVLKYLKIAGVKHGQLSEWPAWYVYPYTSAWAIESLKSPGWAGWCASRMSSTPVRLVVRR